MLPIASLHTPRHSLQTRGILTWVNDAAPGAYHSDVQYVTVAGRFIQGAPLMGPGSWQQRVVGAGYKQVCGDATAWGDGVVPVPSGESCCCCSVAYIAAVAAVGGGVCV
jgi:hypothetical protein